MEYTKLEYIEGTGTQYIDLGFKLSSNHAVDMDLQMVKLNANIFGSRAGAMDRAFTLFSSTSVIMTDMGGTRNSTSPTTDRINVYLSSSKIKIGTFERNINSGSFTTPGNGYIFNISYSRPQSYMASMKLYGCKIYLSGTLIRDLIPCKYNNQIGLWDTINGSFLGNAGTGEFVAGPTIGPKTLKVKTVDKNNLYTKLEYIEGTGTQWVDTGIQPITTTKIATKCSFSVDGGNVFIGATELPDNNDFRIFRASGQYLYFDRGSSRLNNSLALNTVYELEFGNWYIKINGQTVQSGNAFNIGLSSSTIKVMPTTNSDYGRIYYLKIYDGDTLVRDFIPTKRNSDNEIGLYDKVTNQFFANNGTGEFVAGPYSLIGKTVSKINGKYIKSINGVSIQCWKKKYK